MGNPYSNVHFPDQKEKNEFLALEKITSSSVFVLPKAGHLWHVLMTYGRLYWRWRSEPSFRILLALVALPTTIAFSSLLSNTCPPSLA